LTGPDPAAGRRSGSGPRARRCVRASLALLAAVAGACLTIVLLPAAAASWYGPAACTQAGAADAASQQCGWLFIGPAPAATAAPRPRHARPQMPSHHVPARLLVTAGLAAAALAAAGYGRRRARMRVRQPGAAPGTRPFERKRRTIARAAQVRGTRQAGTDAAGSPGAGPAPDRLAPRQGDGPARPEPVAAPRDSIVAGLRGGTAIGLASVASGGLGFTGPGALAAVQALLTGLLAAGGHQSSRGPQVVMTEAGARQLIGADETVTAADDSAMDGRLVITSTLTAALDHAETVIMSLLREGHPGPGAGPQDGPGTAPGQVTLAIVASPGNGDLRRLAAVLEAGAAVGIIGLLLGPWEPGATCSISADGTVTSATPSGLTGTQILQQPGGNDVGAALVTLARHVRDKGTRIRTETAPAGPVTSRQPDRSAPGNALASPRPPGTPAISDRLSPAQAGAGDPAPQLPTPRPATVGGNGGAPGTRPAPGPARERPVQARLLGTERIEARGREITTGLRSSSRELLAYLALFPRGAPAEKITAALWPGDTPRNARIALQTALRSLRVALRDATGKPGPMFINYAAGRYSIDASLVDTDLWQFQHALQAADDAIRDGDRDAGQEALTRAAACYQGPLADDAAYEWIEPHREHIRRQAVDALTRLAAMHEPADPRLALTLLDRALDHDPLNEQLHHRIMRLQALLGQHDAIRRTLHLLEIRLRDLGMAPGQDTYDLAAQLQRPRLGPAGAVGSGS
jgi:DNA-binding SARP family transcriptional activator